jgi:serine-type D-Ala-D-Ala carboxypeptidase/endopeptidase (penicillin-binding protein 4)
MVILLFGTKKIIPFMFCYKHINNSFYFLFFTFYFFSCSAQKQISIDEHNDFINGKDLKSAHVGICIYDATANIDLYNYQSDKYFTPASNTKLFSLYAGLKYLGDSLVGIRYIQRDNDILVLPAGDPTLLHPDFLYQPVIDFLKKKKGNVYIADANWQEQALGAGWSWDDYNDDYSAERSSLPVYGNFIRWVQQTQEQKQGSQFGASPSFYSVPEVNWKVDFNTDSSAKHFSVKRKQTENIFEITQGAEKSVTQDVPFVTNGITAAIELLKDTVSKNIFPIKGFPLLNAQQPLIIRSQPVDSLFKPMMYRSDNFFAEQTLLMVSNERLGIMNDEKITDTLLKTDLKELPQKPNWADGSGLSRFNLFTPQDFVFLLKKMKDEFGLERMKRILPTGGQGTLGSRYKQDSGYIFAKTGSLSGVLALSGYLITKKNHLLIFSVLVNNHNGSASQIRNATEKFIDDIRNKY